MHIVILSLVFPPDGVSTAQIMGDLAVDLKSLGHTVTILTTTPHYNQDLDAEAKQKLTPFWGGLLQKSLYHGIPVYHVLMPRKGSSLAARIPFWMSFHMLSTVAGLSLIRTPDVFLVPSPPLTIGLSAWVLGLLHQAPFIYNVQEIYPDFAINLGAIRNKGLISLLRQMESFVYQKATAITVIAPYMAQQLIHKGVPAHKVKTIPNFVDIDDLHPLPKDNDFSRLHHIHDKFVVSYAGNMGPSQDLESFIEAAKRLESHASIHFLMMGNGMLRNTLKEQIHKLGLANLTFLPHQPYSLVPQIYAASDLCLVPQGPSMTSVAVPSKVYRIMACARPVLATTAPQSDLAEVIRASGGGIVVEAGDPQKLAEAIRNAMQSRDRLEAMGQAGRAHVIQHYSRKNISKQYHDLIVSLMPSKGPTR